MPPKTQGGTGWKSSQMPAEQGYQEQLKPHLRSSPLISVKLRIDNAIKAFTVTY